MTTVESGGQRANIDGFAVTIMLGLTFTWGLNQIAIKVANAGLEPVFQAGMRSLLAGLLVLLWCRLRGVELFRRDGTLAAGIAAGVLFGAEFGLIYLALDYTSVSRAIIFLYTMPFFVALGAHLLVPGERLTLVRLAGLFAAFAGVMIAFSDELSLPSPDAPLGDVLCLIAAIGWAAATLLIKTTRLRIAPAEKVLVYQLAVSAVMLLAAAPFFGSPIRAFSGIVAGAFAYQVVIVVAITYAMWFWLLARYPAGQLTTFAFLTPVFGVALGGLVLGEPVSLNLFIALALVAFGIALVSQPRRG
jgi:drug/metabolite transporter (DMT)-like permease